MLKYDLMFIRIDPDDANARPLARRQMNEFASRGYRIAYAAPEYGEDDSEGSIVGWELIIEKDEEIVLGEQESLANQLALVLESIMQELKLNPEQLQAARGIISRKLQEAADAGSANSGRSAQG